MPMVGTSPMCSQKRRLHQVVVVVVLLGAAEAVMVAAAVVVLDQLVTLPWQPPSQRQSPLDQQILRWR